MSALGSRDLPPTWEVCVLGLFPRGAHHRATTRFLDLGFVTAKRLITRSWKSAEAPSVLAWKRSFTTWWGAEGVALRSEDALGLRKYPLSDSWDVMLAHLKTSEPDSTPAEIN
ncbi:hypothetical protein NDU88_002859 [Pleurodeles waltl]|uniref:Uncharacterized protein n=1 Tax=Pleurodeles waltl TaxID=8319 RepID=A0AAV7T3E3_PLEWA|nr:hypothetical protein NDU88_002859 [Pleurodeles waltl]